jgi:hypothetical protein
LTCGSQVISRTQASNKKCSSTSLDEEKTFREEIISEQIRTWRSLLPDLIRKFSKISDPRRTKSIKHSLTVLMMFGLFAFIFKLASRREMNRELTGPVIREKLKKLFPEITSIPHADTLARLLEKTNPKDIEAIHFQLIKSLVKKKKFKKMLIQGYLPVSVDGSQKLYRDGELHDMNWCQRKVGDPDNPKIQQYVYVLEANITLKNGLSIPLMTEYLYRENNQMLPLDSKQDSETTAFERLANRLKKHFPRLQMLFFMDALYATQSIMGLLHKHHWEYIIRLPKRKLTDFAKQLNSRRSGSQAIPDQAAYREREQYFYWENDIPYGYDWELCIHLVACVEHYYEVNKKTGEIEDRYSEHAWISSLRLNINNVHELLNLGARKKELIEDNFNTEKNRGYRYKHAFSYNWNAMQGFHYLMRLGHAINALSEFTKKLKQYIKSIGCSATLKLIKDTLFNPWFPAEWFDDQKQVTPQLRFQFE